jgi:hypothetical protein
MASTTETVEVELVLKAKEFRDQLKQASTDANKFNKGVKDVQKAGGKQDKDLQKLAKDANKFNKGAAKGALDHEKALLGLMKKRHSEMKKIGNTNSKEFKDKRKEATETLELYTDISKARRAAEGGERGGGSGIGRSLFNGLKGGALKVAGMAVGALTQRVTDAGSAALQLKAAGINLAGDKTIANTSDLKRLTNIGVGLGYDPMETAAQAAAMSRATGRGNQVVEGQQFARAGMLDMGQATSFMGLQARGGQGSAESKRDLEQILTNAFANGLEKGRFGEYLEGLTSLVEGAQGRTAGNVTGAEYARSLSILDSSGQSGLQGARGSKVLSQLEQGFMSGGGAAGKAMSLSAMGFGTPGGTTSYYEAMKQMQQGFAGEKGSGNMMKMLQNLKYRYGGNSESAVMAGSAQTGLSYDIMEKILGLTGDSAAVQKEIAKLTEGAKPLEEQMVDALTGELSDQARNQSARQQQLVDQGFLITDELNSLQDATNQMVDKYWPIAIKALEIIAGTLEVVADAVTDAYDFWKEVIPNIPGFKTKTRSEMSPEERANYDAKQVLKDVVRQVKSGTMTEAEGRSLLFAESAKNDARRAEQVKRGNLEKAQEYVEARDTTAAGHAKILNRQTASARYTQEVMKEQAAQEEKNKKEREALAADRALAKEVEKKAAREREKAGLTPDGKANVEGLKKIEKALDSPASASAPTSESGNLKSATNRGAKGKGKGVKP